MIHFAVNKNLSDFRSSYRFKGASIYYWHPRNEKSDKIHVGARRCLLGALWLNQAWSTGVTHRKTSISTASLSQRTWNRKAHPCLSTDWKSWERFLNGQWGSILEEQKRKIDFIARLSFAKTSRGSRVDWTAFDRVTCEHVWSYKNRRAHARLVWGLSGAWPIRRIGCANKLEQLDPNRHVLLNGLIVNTCEPLRNLRRIEHIRRVRILCCYSTAFCILHRIVAVCHRQISTITDGHFVHVVLNGSRSGKKWYTVRTIESVIRKQSDITSGTVQFSSRLRLWRPNTFESATLTDDLPAVEHKFESVVFLRWYHTCKSILYCVQMSYRARYRDSPVTNSTGNCCFTICSCLGHSSINAYLKKFTSFHA